MWKRFKPSLVVVPDTGVFDSEGNSTLVASYISFSASFPTDFLVLTSCDILKTLVGMCKPRKSLSAKIFFGFFIWTRYQMLTVLKSQICAFCNKMLHFCNY